ncbi:MAG TPA: hypothetical protein VIG24_13480 [Acidimicrobiia bacterium]
MYPQLEIYLDDSTEPTIVQPLTVDFEVAEMLYPGGNVTDSGLRLVVAYCHVEGKEPKNTAEVRVWARERKARIMVGKEPDPTQSDQSDG